MGADAAEGHYRAAASPARIGEQELQLARLVAAVEDAALVVTLHPQPVDPLLAGEARQRMYRSGQVGELDPRQTPGAGLAAV